MLHGIVVLFETINLYLTINDLENMIDIDKLEDAYNILVKKMKDIEDAEIDYCFNDALDFLLNNYSDYFYFENEELHIIDDIDDLYDNIVNSIQLTANDDILQDAVLDTRIFNVLNIEAPLDEYSTIFNLNKEIVKTYKIIAQDEGNNILNIINVIYLKRLIKNLNNKLSSLEYLDILKIKMCIAYYNLVLNNDTNEYENLGWHIALFNDDEEIKKVLNHERIAYIIDEVDPIDDDTDDDENLIIKNNLETINNDNQLCYEVSYFLSALLLKIDEYTKKELPTNLKNILVTKKNLLLTTRELKNMEDYFLAHGNFHDYKLSEFTMYEPNDRFTSLYNETIKRILDLDYQDKEMNNNIYARVIIDILFIRNYLDLSLNKEKNNEIINQIIFSKFYQNHNYSIVNTLLNKIIFNKKHIKER